jgi:hypothetical protein
MLPHFRGKAMVQKGVGYYFIFACFFQAQWTLEFAYEKIGVSLVFMIHIWAALSDLLYSQYNTPSESTLAEFWLLRFPFAIHYGWVTVALALNVNVLVVGNTARADIQLAVGIISLVVLHAISVWVLFAVRKANYTLAAVLSWASWWVHSELQSPKNKIVQTFAEDTISGVSYAAAAVAVIIMVQIAARVTLDVMDQIMDSKTCEAVQESLQEDACRSGDLVTVAAERKISDSRRPLLSEESHV